MKKYIKPELFLINASFTQMLAGSPDGMGVSDEACDPDAPIQSRYEYFDW